MPSPTAIVSIRTRSEATRPTMVEPPMAINMAITTAERIDRRTARLAIFGDIATATAGTTAQRSASGVSDDRTTGAMSAMDRTSSTKNPASVAAISTIGTGLFPMTSTTTEPIVATITKPAKIGVTISTAGTPTTGSRPNAATTIGAVDDHAAIDTDAAIEKRSRTKEIRRRPTPSEPPNQRRRAAVAPTTSARVAMRLSRKPVDSAMLGSIQTSAAPASSTTGRPRARRPPAMAMPPIATIIAARRSPAPGTTARANAIAPDQASQRPTGRLRPSTMEAKPATIARCQPLIASSGATPASSAAWTIESSRPVRSPSRTAEITPRTSGCRAVTAHSKCSTASRHRSRMAAIHSVGIDAFRSIRAVIEVGEGTTSIAGTRSRRPRRPSRSPGFRGGGTTASLPRTSTIIPGHHRSSRTSSPTTSRRPESPGWSDASTSSSVRHRARSMRPDVACPPPNLDASTGVSRSMTRPTTCTIASVPPRAGDSTSMAISCDNIRIAIIAPDATAMIQTEHTARPGVRDRRVGMSVRTTIASSTITAIARDAT